MLETLEKYYNEGWLYKQTHPTLDLTIWNYSAKTQYERNWDSITLMCRGLVTNSNGIVIARPFEKFFNYEEVVNGWKGEKLIPDEPFDVYKKMDGSCIICFFYNDEWICATRGSFISEQSQEAMRMKSNYPIENLDKQKTYIFEIIY